MKLEGGEKVVPAIKKLVAAGIPVMGHLGLTPQSVHALGGFKVQGRGESGEQILKDAKALEMAGVFAIVLEAIPAATNFLIAGTTFAPPSNLTAPTFASLKSLTPVTNACSGEDS